MKVLKRKRKRKQVKNTRQHSSTATSHIATKTYWDSKKIKNNNYKNNQKKKLLFKKKNYNEHYFKW